MRIRSAFGVLLFAIAVAGCADGIVPEPFGEGVPVWLSLHAPAAVSTAEVGALAAAFDRVDSYGVIVQDSATGTIVAEHTSAVSADGDQHVLDLRLAESTVGMTIRVTVIGYEGSLELYRAGAYMEVVATTDPSALVLAIRYTGPGVRGTITDQDGSPLADVVVQLLTRGTVVDEMVTEQDGTYLFVDVAAGVYEVEPSPPGASVCPSRRSIEVASLESSIVANFTTSAVPCDIRLLVLSGGDVDDTQGVASLFEATPGMTTETFFLVNQTPGVDALRAFDVVLLFANGQFNQSNDLGDEVAAYVGAGGNVVIASFYWQDRSDSNLGSTGWGALESIDPFRAVVSQTTGQGGATYQPGSLDALSMDTRHPLTSGLQSIVSTGYRGGVAAVTGTTVVASWDDGTPFVGYRLGEAGQRFVAVSLFPAPGASSSGDTQLLWENAVTWAGAAGGP